MSQPSRFRWLSRGGILNRPRILPSILFRTDEGAEGGEDTEEGVPPFPVEIPSPPDEARSESPPAAETPPGEEEETPCPFVDNCNELVDLVCSEAPPNLAGKCREDFNRLINNYAWRKIDDEGMEEGARAIAEVYGVDLDKYA